MKYLNTSKAQLKRHQIIFIKQRIVNKQSEYTFIGIVNTYIDIYTYIYNYIDIPRQVVFKILAKTICEKSLSKCFYPLHLLKNRELTRDLTLLIDK